MMNKRSLLVAGGVLGLVVVGVVGWYLASPLFIDNPVDEAFPFDLPGQNELEVMSSTEMKDLETEFMAALPDEEEVVGLSPEVQEQVVDRIMTAANAVMTDKEVDDEMMEKTTDTEWIIVAQGQFMDADSFHQGSGRATIFQQGENRVIRFEDFSVTNGPDLHVILTKHPIPTNRAEVGSDYIDLGQLKGNLGNQNYEIPADVNLSDYQSVIIYCMPFHVIFATATLG